MLGKVSRSQLIALAVGLVLVALGGIYAFRTSWQSALKLEPGAPAQVSLRLKWLFDPGFAGEMVAAKAGLFEKHGIRVDLKPGGFEADPVKLVAAGSDQIGVAGADSFLIARSKGVPIVAFAAGYIETPVAFYVHGDSGISTPRDFIGKKVGYQGGQDTGTVYETLLRKVGVDRTRIIEVPVKFDFTPFLSKQVDVWPGYAAGQSAILEREKIPYRMILPADYRVSFIGTVYFTTEEFLKKNPQIIEAFTRGLIDGWRLTYEDETTAIPLIESYDPSSLKPELIKFTLQKQKPTILPPGFRFGEFRPAQWQSLQHALLDAKLIPEAIELGKAVTYQALDAAYKTN